MISIFVAEFRFYEKYILALHRETSNDFNYYVWDEHQLEDQHDRVIMLIIRFKSR